MRYLKVLLAGTLLNALLPTATLLGQTDAPPTFRCSCCSLGESRKVTLPPGYFSNFDLKELASLRRPVLRDGVPTWEYQLEVTDAQLQLANGKYYKVWAFNGRVPGPTIIAREGERVRIILTNKTSTPHTIHSHGLFVPNRMDGVAHSLHGTHNFDELPDWAKPVLPGLTFTYEYIARPAGTHWYHCHVNANEHLDRGMSGAFIVLPKLADPEVDHDVIMVLDEWNSKYVVGGVPGHPAEVGDYDFFTINGQSFPYSGTLAVGLGETLRIRFINAGAQSHSMHIHGHTFLVTHRDGALLPSPIERDTVPVSPGECADVVLVANNPGTWPIHCHSVSHQTNAGAYPGGMMVHLVVGREEFPNEGDGPEHVGLHSIAKLWREHAVRVAGFLPAADPLNGFTNVGIEVGNTQRAPPEMCKPRQPPPNTALLATAQAAVEIARLPEHVILPEGNAETGKKMFQERCSACHRHGETGSDVGPRLRTFSHWPRERLIDAVLAPNREMGELYTTYIATTKGGHTYVGILSMKSEDKIVLVQPGGIQKVVSRNELDQFHRSPQSLMPAGLANTMTLEEFGSLLAFIQRSNSSTESSLDQDAD